MEIQKSAEQLLIESLKIENKRLEFRNKILKNENEELRNAYIKDLDIFYETLSKTIVLEDYIKDVATNYFVKHEKIKEINKMINKLKDTQE